MTSELSAIDQVRWERDQAKVENIKLRRENERLRMLLGYANEAAREEFRLRVAERTARQEIPEHD